MNMLEKLDKIYQEQNDLYTERSILVSALSKIYPAYLMEDNSENVSETYSHIACVELPTGQATWHIHSRDLNLFDHLVLKENNWDGHSTEEKLNRIKRLKCQKIK